MKKRIRFPGGINPEGHKTISSLNAIAEIPLSPRLIYPLLQHDQQLAKPLVSVGDRVLKYQTIAKPTSSFGTYLHSASSGIVECIQEHPIVHSAGVSCLSVTINTDTEDKTVLSHSNETKTLRQLLETIHQSGIAGLGGANFPTAEKLNKTPINTIIINGAECEPYITCDDRLMQEKADEILLGLQQLHHAFKDTHIIFAIEDNKPEAIQAIQTALNKTRHPSFLQLTVIPTQYPTGGEKQLIRVTTGNIIPKHQPTIEHGLVCINVGTVYAIYQAVTHHQPLIERIVTLTGNAIRHPRNYRIRLGTPIKFLLDSLQADLLDEDIKLIQGGSLMGVPILDSRSPITKASNCILVSKKPTNDLFTMPCIRCGRCAEVCPSVLLPQQLHAMIQGNQVEKANDFHINDCIECGCCDYVCPSHIPLVEHFRYAKSTIKQQEKAQQAARLAKERFEFRQERLKVLEQEKAKARAEKLAALTKKKNN